MTSIDETGRSAGRPDDSTSGLSDERVWLDSASSLSGRGDEAIEIWNETAPALGRPAVAFTTADAHRGGPPLWASAN